MSGNKISIHLKKIGCRLGDLTGKEPRGPKQWIDIEDTLVEASNEIPKDPRLFGVLLAWFEIHGDYVLFEKLAKKVKALDEDSPARTWLNALFIHAAHKGNHQCRRWIWHPEKPIYLYPKQVADSAIAIKGAIPYFKEMNYLFPEGSIRVRESDVFSREELLKRNRQYRNRYLYGSSWRADIITAIEFGMSSPTEISNRIGCSYEPAHRIFNEYRLAKKSAA